MSTAKQRRRKKMAKRCAISIQRTFSLRQRVTMEVARLANLLGLTMQPHSLESGHDKWSFIGRQGFSVLEYFPVSGTVYRPLACLVGKDRDVLSVLALASNINEGKAT
jgi:hypothetical protein